MNSLESLEEHAEWLKHGLIYLDRSGNLSDIRTKCLSFCDIQDHDIAVHKFVIKVSPRELLEVSASLGNLLLNKPSEAETIFQEVVFCAIKTLNLLPVNILKSQISVSIRLQSLPALQDLYQVNVATGLRSYHQAGRFVGFEGVVIGLSAVSSYTQSTQYHCIVDGCRGQDGKQYIRVHVPGATELQTIRNDFMCFHCGMPLNEDKSKRVLAEKLVAEFVQASILGTTLRQALRFQAIPVYLRDDLVGIPVIGERYRVYGLVRTDGDNQNLLAIEANNIEMISQLDCMSLSVQKGLPKDIQSLYNEHSDSPWSFVQCLAFLFAETITPPGSFHKLKLGILLSLVLSGNSNKENCSSSLFHILACGFESSLVNRLFLYGCSLSDRAISHNSCNALTGCITKDRFENSNFFVEGGSLSLAYKGICYLGDIGTYKKQVQDNIKSTLDTGQVVIDVKSKFSHGLPQQHSQPLRCQMWAYTDLSTQKSNTCKDDLFITGDTGELPKALVDVFSLVFFVDYSESTMDLDEDISYDILKSAMEPSSNHISLSYKDFQKYLTYARSCEVILTPGAEVLLQGYYQASRKMRASGMAGSTVPMSTLSSLYAISLAHAKLSLRREVTESDALLAIYLNEECLTSRYGFSILSVRPVAHMSSNDFNLQNMDAEMYKFHSRLVQFCGGDYTRAPGPEE